MPLTRLHAGASKEELAKSPFLEKLLQKGLEVVFMTDAIDEYVMSHLTEFDDAKFQNASKDNLKLGKDDKKAAKALKARAGPLQALSPLRALGRACSMLRARPGCGAGRAAGTACEQGQGPGRRPSSRTWSPGGRSCWARR